VYEGGPVSQISNGSDVETSTWVLVVITQDLRLQDKLTKPDVGAFDIIDSLRRLMSHEVFDIGGTETKPVQITNIGSTVSQVLEKKHKGLSLYTLTLEIGFYFQPDEEENLVEITEIFQTITTTGGSPGEHEPEFEAKVT